MRDHFEGPGADGRIILIWICRKWDGGMNWIDRVEAVGGHCKWGNKPSGFIKRREFLD